MRFALCLLAALPLSAATGIAGKWTLEGDVQGNPIAMTCTMEQSAEAKITGNCTINNEQTVPVTGTAKDAKFTFTFTASGYTLTYTGTVEGDTMKGGIEVAGTDGTFSGKRAAN